MRAVKRLESTEMAANSIPVTASVSALPGRRNEDAALMASVHAGRDRAAFDELANHYAPRLKGWLVNRGESGPTAEDIVQDVLVTVWHKAGKYDPAKASFSTWVYRLTRNRWIDHKRKHDRLQPMAPDMMAVMADAPVPSAEADTEKAQMAAAVQEALADLPPEQKRMLYLAFFEGLSHSEISARTGVALGTVKSRIRAPLKKLRDELIAFKSDM